MSSLVRPTSYIQHEISQGKQDVNATFIFNRGPSKVRIKIKSDSYDFQSFARAELFDASSNSWSIAGTIHHGQMSTPPKLCYMPKGTGVTFQEFSQDFDTLLAIVDGLLAAPVKSAPMFVLTFCDVSEDEHLDAGLIGPLFFPEESAALLQFAHYFVPRMVRDEIHVEDLLICVCLYDEHDGLERLKAASHETIMGWLSKASRETLRSLCDSFVAMREKDGRRCFYRVTAVPEAV